MKPITTGVIIFIGSAISAILLYFLQNLGIRRLLQNCGLGMCINCDLIDTPYSFDYEIFLG